MRRVRVEELVSGLILICSIPMVGQGQVAGATQWILRPFQIDCSELVPEAQVDVVEEAGAVRAKVLVRIERLHDILLASLTVLGRWGQVAQVNEEVLRPVFQVLLGHRAVSVPVDPVADVLGKPFVEFIEVLGNDESVVSNIPPVSDCERIGFAVFDRNICEIDRLVFNCGGIALHGTLPFERNLNYMRASLRGRDELTARVQQALALLTKKEAEYIVDAVIGSLEATLLNNLEADGFTLKLGSFGKFSVRHKSGILRKIPFTGETILTKDRRKVRFISLGSLRQLEKVPNRV
jgi:nucleoid DNA-binding protein